MVLLLRDQSEPAPQPALEERVAALELLLQQLVQVLDAERQFSARALGEWNAVCLARMQETGSASAGTVAALQRLVQAA